MMKQEMNCTDISNRQLDKDVLVPGNKVYSPETCHFVSREVNCMFRSNGVDSKKKVEDIIQVASQLKEPYDYILVQALLFRGREMAQKFAS